MNQHSTYRITWTYTGEIVDEVTAGSVQEALERAADRAPHYSLTAMVEGMEVDLYREMKPSVTLVPAPKRCPECLGEGGRHNTIHERYATGGGGVNRPCSLGAQSASV